MGKTTFLTEQIPEKLCTWLIIEIETRAYLSSSKSHLNPSQLPNLKQWELRQVIDWAKPDSRWDWLHLQVEIPLLYTFIESYFPSLPFIAHYFIL